MNIEKIAVQLRIRDTWESIDLGFEMAKHWFFPLWKIYIISALPVFMLLSMLFHTIDNDWLVILIFWWFKPLYEPPLTYWLSRTLFSQKIQIKDVFKQWKWIISPHLFSNLTWNRFSPHRSFFSPVFMLERATGKTKNRRLHLLAKDQKAHLLSSTTFTFEWVLFLTFSLYLYLMMPNEFDFIQFISNSSFNTALVSFIDNSLYFLALSIIAPFYVSAGFSLYINRRTVLEAWDLEIEFKKMSKKYSNLD